MQSRRIACAVALALASVGLVGAGAAAGSGARQFDPPPWANKVKEPSDNVNHDVSPPLRDLAPAPAPDPSNKKDKEPKKGIPVPDQSASDPVVQSTPGTAAAPA